MAGKILLADDDQAFRSWAQKTLIEAGFEVLEAADGECALAIGSEGKADLFLLDLVLPKLLGTEVCEQLRQRSESKDIPVVFLCDNDTELREVRGIDDGDARAEDLLLKPVPSMTLVRVVSKWVASGRSRNEKGKNRRKKPRAPADLKAEVSIVAEAPGGEERVGGSRITSISESGAFVLTGQLWAAGTVISVEFSGLEGEEEISVEAQVAYGRMEPEAGVGVVFVNLSQPARDRIRRYVELVRRLVQ